MKLFKRITSFLTACAMLGVGNTLSYSGDNVWAVDSEDVKAIDNGDDEVYSGKCGEDVYWKLSDGILEIYGTGDMEDFSHYSYGSDRVVPWHAQKGNIYDVIIHEGVTSIGSCAFNRCYSLTNITIPDSVLSVGDEAFYNCDSLTSITIPENVSLIGRYAFGDCNSLASIIIPESVSSICAGAFSNTPWLEEQRKKSPFVIINNILVDATTYEGDITIPDDISSIACGAFRDCKSLTSITIPDSISSIGDFAFYGCTSLTSITIPDSVSSIGACAFFDTPWLEEQRKKSPFVIINNILVDATICEGDITIPDDISSIADGAFFDCKSLTSVTIPNSISSISNSAFELCGSLSNITILDGVSSIGNYAFCDCTSLTSITIPDSVSSIGYSAFSGCVNLENVYYTGTEEQWRNETRIKKGNSPLTSATIHYNDNVYEEPTEDQMVFLKFIVQKIQRISELLVNLIDQNTIFGVIKYFFQTKL
ncbi:MAG: leucine-rich repeat domain-containing protein [Oscillospiraceae bacterium]|nr:leucine-rich repeat domain-containing protein [Oscillospiraceae bacterium]